MHADNLCGVRLLPQQGFLLKGFDVLLGGEEGESTADL